jgi:hypothetical protein
VSVHGYKESVQIMSEHTGYMKKGWARQMNNACDRFLESRGISNAQIREAMAARAEKKFGKKKRRKKKARK